LAIRSVKLLVPKNDIEVFADHQFLNFYSYLLGFVEDLADKSAENSFG
jgi:hypothetical protein